MAARIPASKLSRRRKKVRTRRLLIILVLSLLLIAAGVAVLNLSLFRIQKILVNDPEGREELIRDEISKTLAGRYYLILPKDSTLLFSRTDVRKAVTASVDDLADQTIDLRGTTLVVNVFVREPALIWCGKTPPEAGATAPEQCYLVDNEGLLYVPAPSLVGNAITRYYGSLSNEEVLGSRFAPQIISKLAQFSDALQAYGLRATRVLIDEVGDGHVFTQTGTRVDFLASDDLRETERSIDRLYADPALSGYVSGKEGKFKYIDLRFKGRLFYKLAE